MLYWITEVSEFLRHFRQVPFSPVHVPFSPVHTCLCMYMGGPQVNSDKNSRWVMILQCERSLMRRCRAWGRHIQSAKPDCWGPEGRWGAHTWKISDWNKSDSRLRLLPLSSLTQRLDCFSSCYMTDNHIVLWGAAFRTFPWIKDAHYTYVV